MRLQRKDEEQGTVPRRDGADGKICGANLSEKAQLSSAPAKKRNRMKKDDNLYVVLKV